MLIRAALSLLMRTRDSGDYTMNSGSCLSASTMAFPTITGGSVAMSAYSSSNASACVRTRAGQVEWAEQGQAGQPDSSVDTQKCFPKKQDKVKKRVIWGIEVAEELQWKGWELGKEITKNLVLKNLSLKIQKIKYRPPKTKFFFTVIPQPIFLSPGITLSLPIIFRPLEEKECVDQLWFEKAEGMFCVDLRAALPCHNLICPPSLQLPMCAMGDMAEAWFCLDNAGDLPTFFTWESPSPFQMLPTTGLLEPGQACRIKVTFQPLMAIIYDVQATCWYGEGSKQKSSIQLQAVAKCAQLLVSIKQKRPEDQDAEGVQKVLHFGSVAVGCTAERQIKLIEVAPDMLAKDEAFSCPTAHGIVPPGEKKCVSVFFHPETLDVKTMDYLSIMPSGCASQTLLKVVGFCRGPDVSLQYYCVDFSWVNLGKRSEQSLWIENKSDCTAHFQFDIDCQESVFSIRPAFGTLVGKARMTLHCAFQPTHPIIYFRRVACFIHHQHLAWYRTHLVRGLTLYPPDILGIMLREKKLERDKNGALMIPTEDLEDKPAPQYPLIPPMTEYFFDGTNDMAIFPPPVSIEPVEVDFGACPRPKDPNPVPLCLMNYTKGKITVAWTRRADCPFWVTPNPCDVPPLKSTAMRLHFQPPHPNCLYAVELEAFAVYKVLRSYNNIEEDCTVCPSWCLRLRARGHSYCAGLEHHIPQYTLDAPKLFPAVSPSEPSYRSLLLINKGSMLLTFNLAPRSSSDVSLRPSSGLVPPGAHQIFLISTYPKGTSWKQHVFYLQFNFCPQYLKEVSMQSREEPLQLKLDTCKSVFFKPTWVGCSSTSLFTFQNPSRLPLEFEWRVSQQHRKMLAVQPTRGIIQPNESLTLTWTFSPLEETKYLFRVGMWVWEAGLPPNTKPSATTHYMLRLVGMGITSSLSAKEKELDFGNVLVNSKQTRMLVLLNDGNCTLYYRLFLEQCSPEAVGNGPLALQLDRTEGSMPPRSQDTICLTACPKHRSQYSWTISYSLLSHRDNKVGEKQELCRVSLMAVYPLLSILDICSMGSAEGITRKHLWRLFSLDLLNSYLERDPTPWELTYRVPTRHSTSQIPSVFTPLKLNFNFGAAPIDAPPSVVLLALKNSGVVPLDWAFLFPSDQQIDLELWAEQVEFDCTELHQMRVQDNCIFSISPKAGSLSPGQEQMVEFKYSHLFIGTDRLPVLFKVSHGREILLNFIGVTVKLEQKYVHFTSTSHQFIPVPIGDTLPPRQVDVPIHILGWNSAIIRFQGVGYDPHIMGDTAPFHNISSWDNSSIHSRLMVPGQSKCSRLLFLNNISKNETIVFVWQQKALDFGEVSVSPMRGKVAPEETIPFVVTLKASVHASFYSMDLVCKVGSALERSWDGAQLPVLRCGVVCEIPRPPERGKGQPLEEWEAHSTGPGQGPPDLGLLSPCPEPQVYRQKLLKQYRKELQEWKDEKERQEVEFTITDRKAKRRAYCTACEPVRKYRTLPPIKNQWCLNWPTSWNLKIAKEETRWPCPQPPSPGMLSLGLTARAHATDYFLANFSDFTRHFLHRELPKRKYPREESEAGEEESPDKWAPVSKQEKQLLTDCLTIIIRGLLEDKIFHEAVDRNLVEQMPYFCQFWNEQSARFMAQNSSLHLVPAMSQSSNSSEVSKDKEEEEDERRLRKKEEGEEEKKDEGEEEELEEEEEEQVEEEMEEEELQEKEEKLPWTEIKPTLQPTSQESLKWQWQQQLKVLLKEKQEQDEKEAISRLPAFVSLQEALLENVIQNILVEASRGEVVLTSRPRVIALPPLSVPRILTPDSLPAASPGPQQAEMPGSIEPPPTNCLQTPAPTLSDLQL
eukprot:bmy_13368T0